MSPNVLQTVLPPPIEDSTNLWCLPLKFISESPIKSKEMTSVSFDTLADKNQIDPLGFEALLLKIMATELHSIPYYMSTNSC
jgi:hypothetical protein